MRTRNNLLRAAVVFGLGVYWLAATPATASAHALDMCSECISTCPANIEIWCQENCPDTQSGTCTVDAETCPDQMAITCIRID